MFAKSFYGFTNCLVWLCSPAYCQFCRPQDWKTGAHGWNIEPCQRRSCQAWLLFSLTRAARRWWRYVISLVLVASLLDTDQIHRRWTVLSQRALSEVVPRLEELGCPTFHHLPPQWLRNKGQSLSWTRPRCPLRRGTQPVPLDSEFLPLPLLFPCILRKPTTLWSSWLRLVFSIFRQPRL